VSTCELHLHAKKIEGTHLSGEAVGGVKDVQTCRQMQTVKIRLWRMQTLKGALVYLSFWIEKEKKNFLETEINIQHVLYKF